MPCCLPSAAEVRSNPRPSAGPGWPVVTPRCHADAGWPVPTQWHSDHDSVAVLPVVAPRSTEDGAHNEAPGPGAPADPGWKQAHDAAPCLGQSHSKVKLPVGDRNVQSSSSSSASGMFEGGVLADCGDRLLQIVRLSFRCLYTRPTGTRTAVCMRLVFTVLGGYRRISNVAIPSRANQPLAKAAHA